MRKAPRMLLLLGLIQGVTGTGILPPSRCLAAKVSAVAWTGLQAPGGSSTNVLYTSFSNATVNDLGTVAFNATVCEVFTWPWGAIALPDQQQTGSAASIPTSIPSPTPFTIKTTNSWSGIWTIDSKANHTLVVRAGDAGYPFISDMGGFFSLGSPLLNNSNLCAFYGGYTPGFIMIPPALPGAPITNFLSVYGGHGVWLSTSPDTAPVAFVGESAPGYTSPFTTSVGTLTLASSKGTNLPTPINFTNRPVFTSIDRIILPDGGGLLFTATTSTTNYIYPPKPKNPLQPIPKFMTIQPLLQHGVWGQDPQGRLVSILHEGESLYLGKSNRLVATLASGAASSTLENTLILSPGSVNPSGELAINAAFNDGSQGVVVASARLHDLSLAAVTGDPVPGGTANDFFVSFGTPSINAAGHTAFRATAGFVTPYPVVYAARETASSVVVPQPTNPPPFPPRPTLSYTNTWSGLWVEDANGTLRQVTRLAPPVPDIGGFSSLGDPLINANHQVAFSGTYRQGFILLPPGTFAGGIGVWTSLNLTNPVAWVGQPAPGYPTSFTNSVKSPYRWSTNIISFTSVPPRFSSLERIAFPDTGRLVLWATATATNPIPRPPVPKGIVVTQEIRSSVLTHHGIWIQNASGGMDLALREGMSVSVNGTNKVVASLPLPSSTDPSGGQETLCSRSNGIVVTVATFTDRTQAVLKITPWPEPKSR